MLCSRSYFEIVSRLSDDYGRLFEYSGVRHDKHVREHDVYEVRTPTAAATSGYDLPVVPATVSVPPQMNVSDGLLDGLSGILAKFEGPLAKVLVRRAFSNGAGLEEGVKAIASQMHDPKEADEFVRLAKALHKTSGT